MIIHVCLRIWSTKVQTICEICKFLFGVLCFVGRYYGYLSVKV